MRRILLIAFLCLTACQGMLLQLKQPLEGEGEVYLYLQPFPQEADRIRFTIGEISARGSDGREFPFSVRLSELKGREMTRQRLLGTAELPPGSYRGLSLRIKEAHIKLEEGEAALLAPDAPVPIDFPFTVVRKKTSLIALTFKPAGSVTRGFGFSPLFSPSIPSRPVDGLTGYVTNYGSNNITVFDKKAGQAVGMITAGGAPAGIALDQRGRKAYVALPTADVIEVIDVTAGEVNDRIMLSLGDHPRELALTPDGKTLLTANTGSNTVSVIDLTSLSEVSRITVGNGPNSVLMAPSGRRAYVFNSLSSTISVIDIANRALVTTIATDPGPLRGQFNRRGDRFYVIHEWSSYLGVIDTATLAVVKRISVGMGIKSLKVDANTDLVYLGKEGDAAIGVYEPNSFVPVDFIQTGAGTTYLTMDGDENNLVMVIPSLQRLMITNLISRKTMALIDVGEAPYGATSMGER